MYNYDLELPDQSYGTTIAAKAAASFYLIGLNSNKLKEKILKDFNLSDDEYDNLIYIAAGIPAVETAFGTGQAYQHKEKLKNKYRKLGGLRIIDIGTGVQRANKRNATGGEYINDVLEGYMLGESKGIINLKEKAHPTPKDYKELFEDNSYQQQAVKAVYHLAKLYTLAKKQPKVYYRGNNMGTFTEMPIWDRVILMYNQGHITTKNNIFNASTLKQESTVDQFGLNQSYIARTKLLLNKLNFTKNGKLLLLKNNNAELFQVPIEALKKEVGYSANIPLTQYFNNGFVTGRQYAVPKIPYRGEFNLEDVQIPINADLQADQDISIFGHKIAAGLYYKVRPNYKGTFTVDVWNSQYDTPEQRALLKRDLARNLGKKNQEWKSLNLLESNLKNFKKENDDRIKRTNDMMALLYAKRMGWRTNLPSTTKINLHKDMLVYDRERMKREYVPGLSWRPARNMNGEIALDPETGSKIWDCSRFSNRLLLTATYPDGSPMFNYHEVGDDAWNRLTSGLHEKLLYNGFHNIPLKFGMPYSDLLEELIKKNNIKAAENFKNEFDLNTLDPNENYVVSITYKDSGNVRLAYQNRSKNNATTITSTHTGNAYWEPIEAVWRVIHNTSSKLHDNKMTDLIGNANPKYAITAIAKLFKNPVPASTNKKSRLELKLAQKQEYLNQVVKTAQMSKWRYLKPEKTWWDNVRDTFGF